MDEKKDIEKFQDFINEHFDWHCNVNDKQISVVFEGAFPSYDEVEFTANYNGDLRDCISDIVDLISEFDAGEYAQERISELASPDVDDIDEVTSEAQVADDECYRMQRDIEDKFLLDSVLGKLEEKKDNIKEQDENVRTATVILIEPGKFPVEKEIPRTESALNALLMATNGCEVEHSPEFDNKVNKQAYIMVDESGIPNHRPENRTVGGFNGSVDILYGPIAVVGNTNMESGDYFGEIPDEVKDIVNNYFHSPEKIEKVVDCETGYVGTKSEKSNKEFDVKDPVKTLFENRNSQDIS